MTPADEEYYDLFNSIYNFLIENYEPADNPTEADFHFTTEEIFHRLQKFLPSDCYNAAMVATWLHKANFTFADYGELKFEWIIQKRLTEKLT